MVEEKKNKTSVLDTIILDLTSNNDEAIIGALKKIPTKGNNKVIIPLIETYIRTQNESIKGSIQTILFELKDTTTLDDLISSLNKGNDEVDQLILGALWNNNFNPVDHLYIFVKTSINGSYLTAFEGLTLIESMDGEFLEDHVMDSVFDLTEAIDKNSGENIDILKTMLAFLAEMNQRI